ncbi:UDP-N-acetylmuramyl pentapeptide phosphotransferase [Brevibacillus sp. SYP-B805]|uniref:UDP-N-acetylmuramyl pentapeptide phosphotransferase n=1 Tax=Brevibacillus sp. SYP-B805 TaxID=1578199 RepID=UPI0013E9C261|nr:UDP-N-acetylmuramyl pentapeptide phosphotransferase [Brevibacillus sp. SYP-B805]NGQ94684.1 UDP-N-acetylmuramyl pentapeptide phosphotransferase [Brevibacillus sp. SYP-B805]
MGLMLTLAVLLPAVLHLVLFRTGLRLLQRRGMVRVNYLGRAIPTAGGLFLLCYHALTVAVLVMAAHWTRAFPIHVRELVMLMCGSVAMALWGWQDDCSAEKDVKGFRGHVTTLLREGRMTSGMWKAWGGGATAFLVSLALSDGVAELLVHTALLSLAANLLNLFDVRPTRAIKAFWLLASLALLLSQASLAAHVWIIPALAGSCLLFFPDARHRLMLGDTGANYLGFIAGFWLMTTLPLSLECLFVMVFGLLHVLAEFWSFSRVIEAVGWLRRLDQWGRQT